MVSLEEEIKEMMQFSYNEESFAEHMIELQEKIKSQGILMIPIDQMKKVTCLLFLFLCVENEVVRAHSWKTLRYILIDESWWKIFLEHRIDFFLVRALDNFESGLERLQAVSLIFQVIQKYPNDVPETISNCITQTCRCLLPEDPLCDFAASLLSLSVLRNPEIASNCEVIYVMIEMCLKIPVSSVVEVIMKSIMFLLDDCNRPFVTRWKNELIRIFSPLVEPCEESTNSNDSVLSLRTDVRDCTSIINNARIAITIALRSWTGIIHLSSHNCGVSSLFENLPAADGEIKLHTILMLYDLFHLEMPDNFDNFISALKSINPSKKNMQNWSISRGFVSAEALCYIKPNVRNYNMLDLYHGFLLNTFIRCGLLKALIYTINTSVENVITYSCIILLGELLDMAEKLLSCEIFSNREYVQLLICQMSHNKRDTLEKGCMLDSFVIDCIAIFNQWKAGLTIKEIYIQPMTKIILSQYLKPPKPIVHVATTFISLDLTDSDELTMVLREINWESDHLEWNWTAITSLLQNRLLTLKRPENFPSIRFVRTLLHFLKPSSNKFSTLSYGHFRTRGITICIMLLFDLFNKPSEQPEGENLIKEFLADFCGCFKPIISPTSATSHVHKSDNDGDQKIDFNCQFVNSLRKTMSREYFSLIRHLFQYELSVTIICSTQLLSYFFLMCRSTAPHHLIKLIIPCLDYQNNVCSRSVLTRALINCDKESRLYCTNILRVYVRMGQDTVLSWIWPMLKNQLLDKEVEIVKEAISILEEIRWNKRNLHYAQSLIGVFTNIDEKSVKILSRVCCKLLEDSSDDVVVNYAIKLIDSWKKKYEKLYTGWAEESIKVGFSLEFLEGPGSVIEIKKNSFSTYLRMSGEKTHVDEINLPIHFYSELASSKIGLMLLVEQNVINRLVETLTENHETTNKERLLDLKASLWGLGAIASKPDGIDYLIENTKVVPLFLSIATTSHLLSLRGMSLIIINMISRTNKMNAYLKCRGWSDGRSHSLLNSSSMFSQGFNSPDSALKSRKYVFPTPDISNHTALEITSSKGQLTSEFSRNHIKSNSISEEANLPLVCSNKSCETTGSIPKRSFSQKIGDCALMDIMFPMILSSSRHPQLQNNHSLSEPINHSLFKNVPSISSPVHSQLSYTRSSNFCELNSETFGFVISEMEMDETVETTESTHLKSDIQILEMSEKGVADKNNKEIVQFSIANSAFLPDDFNSIFNMDHILNKMWMPVPTNYSPQKCCVFCKFVEFGSFENMQCSKDACSMLLSSDDLKYFPSNELLSYGSTYLIESTEFSYLHASDPMINNEIIRLVVLLSSRLSNNVVMKNLKILRSTHTERFADLCLYNRVIDTISKLNIRRTTRKFIHELFSEAFSRINVTQYKLL